MAEKNQAPIVEEMRQTIERLKVRPVSKQRVPDRFQLLVEFDDARQAAYLHMFLRRCGFDEFFQRTEPHFGKERRTERAYAMSHAAARVWEALIAAGISSSVY